MADDNKKKFGDFIAKIKDVGIARPSHFFVEMMPPPFLLKAAVQNRIEMINLFCQQATLPEMVLNTTPVKDDGLERQVVVDKHYGRMSFVFLVDQDMVIRKYFDDWIQPIVNSRGGTFRYWSEYVVDTITVNQLNSARNIVYKVDLHDCYPVSMRDMPLSMSQTGGHHSVQVDFVYRWWESSSLTTDKNQSNVPDNISTFLQNQRNKAVPGTAQIKAMNLNMKNPANIFDHNTTSYQTNMFPPESFA